MKVGDTVTGHKPSYGVEYRVEGEPQSYPAQVIYIHPQRRFYTLEFKFGDRTIRQSYKYR